MKKIIKKSFLIFILFIIYFFVCALSYVEAVSNDLQKNIFRLHVIANSNSQEDQNLKYKVRDSLISYMETLCSNCNSKQEVIEIVSKNLDNFTNIANQTIHDNGLSYTANVEIGNFMFPTKSYADISFPAGYYDALRVKIGDANGQNWWCVLYPSLCFIDVTSGIVPDDSKNILEENLTNEEYQLVSDTNTLSINIKFKLIEFFTKNNLITAKN